MDVYSSLIVKEGCKNDLEEIKALTSISAPIIVINMSCYVITLISVMSAGRLGDNELAGATLGNSWIRLAGVALMQEPPVAKMASVYAHSLIPGLFACGLIQIALRFCQMQSVSALPLALISAFSVILHIGLIYILADVLCFGLRGTSVSASISLWVLFFMVSIYVKISKRVKLGFEGLSLSEEFRHAMLCFKFDASSATMAFFEQWGSVFMVLLAGLLPDSMINTSIIGMCLNTETIAGIIVHGLSIAVSTVVISSGNLNNTKCVAAVAIKISAFFVSVAVLLLLACNDIWASFFSANNGIIRQFGLITPLLIVFLIFNSAQRILSGIARGCGLQQFVAWTNIIAVHLVGFPLAFLFGFILKLNSTGLLMGFLCGIFYQASTLVVMYLPILNTVDFSSNYKHMQRLI